MLSRSAPCVRHFNGFVESPAALAMMAHAISLGYRI
jgi:hypothetical protein